MAVSVVRCCGGASIGCTCRPSARSSAGSAARRRIGTLVAVCVLVLATHVATAGAEDAPQPPAMPAMPTISVQVDVSIPGVSVNVQTGAVDISVSTESVDVSVSVSSAGTSPSIDVAGSKPQQTTPNDGSTDCCNGGERDVDRGRHIRDEGPGASSGSAGATSTGSNSGGQRGACSRRGATRARRSPEAHGGESGDSTTHDRAAEERHAGCRRGAIRCHSSSAASRRRLGPNVDEGSPVRATALPVEHMRDNRLLLQLGLLVALLYLVCLAGWFSATTLRRTRA